MFGVCMNCGWMYKLELGTLWWWNSKVCRKLLEWSNSNLRILVLRECNLVCIFKFTHSCAGWYWEPIVPQGWRWGTSDRVCHCKRHTGPSCYCDTLYCQWHCYRLVCPPILKHHTNIFLLQPYLWYDLLATAELSYLSGWSATSASQGCGFAFYTSKLYHSWQSHVEIEDYYSVAYFDTKVQQYGTLTHYTR